MASRDLNDDGVRTSKVITHMCTQQPHTVLNVSTDIMVPLLSYLHCGGPPFADPSPF